MLMSANPVKTSLFWNTFVKKCLLYLKNSNFIMVRYEALILDLSKEFNSLLETLKIKPYDFINIPGDLWERLPESHQNIHFNILESPKFSAISEWQSNLSVQDIYMLQLLSKEYLIKLGYIPFKIVQNAKYIITVKALFLTFIYYFRLYIKKIIYRLLKLSGIFLYKIY